MLVLPRGSADSTAALAADRIAVHGNLVLDAGLTAVGSIRVTNRRWMPGPPPFGKDIYASRGFTATGGVRLSLAEVSKSVNFGHRRQGGRGGLPVPVAGCLA